MGKRVKSRVTLAKLYSQAGTGHIYYVRRPRTAAKMSLRKYDPVVRAHVLFSEIKPAPLPEINDEYRELNKIDSENVHDEQALKRDVYMKLYRRLQASNTNIIKPAVVSPVLSDI